MTQPFEPELVRRAIAGERDALASVWETARRLATAVLAANGARSSELEDLLQEIACAFTRGIGSLREPAAFAGWLRTLTLNAVRARRRRPPDSSLEADPCARVDDVIERADDVRAVWSALDELPLELREALLLKAVDGLSQRAIAEALGVPETTVETRLSRARRALRILLAKDHPGVGRSAPTPPCHKQEVR